MKLNSEGEIMDIRGRCHWRGRGRGRGEIFSGRSAVPPQPHSEPRQHPVRSESPSTYGRDLWPALSGSSNDNQTTKSWDAQSRFPSRRPSRNFRENSETLSNSSSSNKLDLKVESWNSNVSRAASPCAKAKSDKMPAVQQCPVLHRFLSDVAGLVSNRDALKLQDFLQIEPPLPTIYNQMIVELRRFYPSAWQNEEAELLRRCEDLVPDKTGGGGSSWIAFPTFMKLYLMFLRDLNAENLLETYNALRGLVK